MSTLRNFTFIYLVPNASPQSVSGLNISSISINVCFSPPPASDQNGVITSFNITFFGSPFQTASVTVNVPVEPTAYPLDRIVCRNLTSLQQNNNYNITVIAINSQGSGPVSQSFVETTNDAGENMMHAMRHYTSTVNSLYIEVEETYIICSK